MCNVFLANSYRNSDQVLLTFLLCHQAFTFGIIISCALLMICLPTMITASCWANSIKQPPLLHCNVKNRYNLLLYLDLQCSVYIWTVSSKLLFSALQNWFKLVNWPFGQCTLSFCPDQPGRNRMYHS